MRKPWFRPPAPLLPTPALVSASPLVTAGEIDRYSTAPGPLKVVAELEEPEPSRLLRRPERPMGYVDPIWISPVVRRYFPYHPYRQLSPYFEHKDYLIFVEARPYAEVVARCPEEERQYEAGLIWAMSYSRQCIKGEEGHHSLDRLMPISPEHFRDAQACGWDLTASDGWDL